MFRATLCREGSGTYRLIWLWTENNKSIFIVAKLFPDKYVAVQFLSCIKGCENYLISCWNTLKYEKINHLDNCDILIEED